MAPDPELVSVASFGSEPLARMWAEALEREGIGVFIKTEGANIGGVITAPVADYHLMVERSQLSQAQEVLGEATEAGSQEDDAD